MVPTMVVTDTTGLEAGMPEAPHAFFADYRPSYREMAAKDGWRRLQDWFKTHDVA
jgi:dienelactone hydrolase